MKANIVEVKQLNDLYEDDLTSPCIVEEDGFLRFSWVADVRWLNFTGWVRKTSICWMLNSHGEIIGDVE